MLQEVMKYLGDFRHLLENLRVSLLRCIDPRVGFLLDYFFLACCLLFHNVFCRICVSGMISNIPKGMVTDQFGMIGLLTFIRAAETEPNLVTLALGRSVLLSQAIRAGSVARIVFVELCH